MPFDWLDVAAVTADSDDRWGYSASHRYLNSKYFNIEPGLLASLSLSLQPAGVKESRPLPSGFLFLSSLNSRFSSSAAFLPLKMPRFFSRSLLHFCEHHSTAIQNFRDGGYQLSRAIAAIQSFSSIIKSFFLFFSPPKISFSQH